MHGVGGKALAGPQEAVEGSRDAGPQHGLILCAIVRPGQVLMENLEIGCCYSASGRHGRTLTTLHSAEDSCQASEVQTVDRGCLRHEMMADGSKVYFHGGNTSRVP